jgi:hypothetical protein
MIPVHPVNVTVGQFVKMRGFKVKTWHYLQWWKVTEIDSEGVIHMVDRTGATSRVRIEKARDAAWRFLAWEPGDDPNDESPDVLKV